MKPTMIRMTAPKASNKVEAFLFEVRKKLIDQAEAQRGKKGPDSQISDDIQELQQRLRMNKELVAVPTDKTNSIVMCSVHYYKEWTKGHLQKSGNITQRSKIQEEELTLINN